MNWRVVFSGKADKMYRDLPETIKDIVVLLIKEIEILGPARGNWKNYGKLEGESHHCHLKSGRPTFVACWRAYKKEKVAEVYYVGTHEKAPY